MATPQQIELRQKLVESLKSGQYQQCSSFLKRDAAYCCLGIACLVAGKTFDFVNKCGGESQVLPPSVQDKFGFSSNVGFFGEEKSLSALNDARVPFSQIADVIASNPPGLFID